MRGVSVVGDENLHGIVQDVYRRYLQIHKYRVEDGAAATLKVYSPLVIKHPKKPSDRSAEGLPRCFLSAIPGR